MNEGTESDPDTKPRERVLGAYQLGELAFENVLTLQRRLVYDIGGERDHAGMIVCDHPAGITIGREGSRLHVRPTPEELNAREWSVRWLSRGGGAMLHVPGQATCYLIAALDRLQLTPVAYLGELEQLILELLCDFGVYATRDRRRPGILVGERRIAQIGVAIRGGVTSFGFVLNVNPDLRLFRAVQCEGDTQPMTSIQREAPSRRVDLGEFRQRLIDAVAVRFGFDRVQVYRDCPGLIPTAIRHAATTRAR